MATPTPPAFARKVLGSTIAKQVGKLWSAETVVIATGLVQAAVLARMLGPRSYGIGALAIAYATLVFSFLDPQSGDAVVRFVAQRVHAEDVSGAAAVVRFGFITDAVLSAVGLLIVGATAAWAARHVVRDPDALALVVVSALGAAGMAPTTTARATLTSIGRYGLVAAVTATAALARTSLIVALVVLGFGPTGMVLGTAVGTVAEGLAMTVAATHAMRRSWSTTFWRVSTKVLGNERRDIARFMAFTEVSTLSAAAVKHADLVVLGAAQGPVAAGVYRLARTFTSPATSVVAPLQAVAYPRLAAIAARNDPRAMRSTVRRMVVGAALPATAVMVLGAALLPVPIRLLAGEQFAAAVTPGRFLLAGAAGSAFTFWARPALQALDHIRAVLVIAVATSAATLGGLLLVAAPAGAPGVAAVRGLLAGVVGPAFAVSFLRRRAWRRSTLRADHKAGHLVGPAQTPYDPSAEAARTNRNP